MNKWKIHKLYGVWWLERGATRSVHDSFDDARKYFIARTKPAQAAAAYINAYPSWRE